MSVRQRPMKAKNTYRSVLPRWTWPKMVAVLVLFGVGGPVAFARGVATAAARPSALSGWGLAEAFTFLFVALGPLNVIGPFAAITHGYAAASKRRLAIRASGIATIALVVAATIGAKTLQAWGISFGALLLTAGAILFLVALRPVLAGYSPSPVQVTTAASTAGPLEPELAFTPLAFPTIITPYGLALLILLFTLYPFGSGGLSILALALIVLALDLSVMLCSDLLAKVPFLKPGLGILGCVMGVLLIAMGVQAVADGLRLLAE